jgi:Lrp/AsnC family leucine-responsive transcriptional regulator
MLDPTDKKILGLLQQDAQLTMKEIASRINLSQTPVHDRIRKLEREGYIERYVCLLNRRRLKKSLMVYCHVTLDKQRKESFEEFNTAISEMSEVLECCVVSGSFDYFLKVVADDVEAYHQFYQQKLSVLGSVQHISSYFVMSEVKSTTELPLD